MSRESPAPPREAHRLFRVFLGLGLRGFGGPMAHIAMFRREFVEERGWIPAEHYDGLVALAQLVPGPASSQVGFMLGWRWAGWRGALAAFAGFTLPSALLMTALAMGWLAGAVGEAGAAVLRGLMLAAVAVVAHAVLSMVRTTGKQWIPLAAAALVGGITVAAPFEGASLLTLAGAALVGWRWPRVVRRPMAAFEEGSPSPVLGSTLALALMGVLIVATWLAARVTTDLPPGLGVAMASFQAGALVFGGGHVVLPLLQAGTIEPGWIAPETFAVGYGAAQALPGPMFAFAAYVGAAAQPGDWSAASALLSLLAIFLPGFVFIRVAHAHAANGFGSARGLAALAMVNAAVIGLLAAACWTLVIEIGVGVGDAPPLVVAFALLLRHARGALWAAATCVVYALAVATGLG